MSSVFSIGEIYAKTIWLHVLLIYFIKYMCYTDYHIYWMFGN